MNRFKAYTLGTLLLSFIGTYVLLSSYSSLQIDLQRAALGLLTVCTVVAFVLLRTAHNIAVVSALQKAQQMEQTYHIGPAASEAEAKEIWRMEEANFGQCGIPKNTGLRWWRKYSQGLFALRMQNKLSGYLSFWPLSKKAYDDFITGKKLESQITEHCIAPPTTTTEKTWWYIGSVVLLANFRKTSAIYSLIYKASMSLLKSLNAKSKITLCALAYSVEGDALLQKFGFRKHMDKSESTHKMSVYIKEAEVAELIAMLDAYQKKIIKAKLFGASLVHVTILKLFVTIDAFFSKLARRT